MADIDIVPKRGTSVWLWVILALLVLAVLWWFMSGEPAPSVELDTGPAGMIAAIAAELVPAA